MSVAGIKYTCDRCNTLLSITKSDAVVSYRNTYRRWWWNKCETLWHVVCPSCKNNVVVVKDK